MKLLRLSVLLVLYITSTSVVNSQTYCASNATSTIDSYVQSVSFASINSSSSLCGTYTDNTANPASVFKGLSYTLSVTSGDCDGGGVYTHELRVWIDWNNDGDFTDPGEEVLTKAPRSAASTETRTISIPPTAASVSTRMRVVATEGTASSCGSYTYGETEDYTINIFSQPEFDANMGPVTAGALGLNGYYQIPFTQGPSYEFSANVRSTGFDTITGTSLNASISNTAYSQSINVGTLVPTADTTETNWNIFSPVSAGDYDFTVVASINENDTVPTNDTGMFRFTVSDTVLARDDSSVTGGIGGTTIQQFGHKFTVNASDTMSTASFFLNSPAVGTSIKLKLYTFSDTALSGAPGPDQLLDSSRVITVLSSSADWYTAEIGCGGRVLSPGDYFISIVQMNPNNMSLGYVTQKLGTDTFLFLDFNDGVGWRDAYHATVNPLVQGITFLLRTNFGRVSEKDILADTSYYCDGASVGVKPGGVFSTFSWSNGSIQDSINVSTSGVYAVTVDDEIGCTFSDSIQVLSRNPIAYVPTVNDASCGGTDGSVISSASGSLAPYMYAWDNGQMGDTLSAVAGGTYSVTVTDSYGCEETENVLVLGKNPVLGSSYTPPTCNGDADGVASVSVVEGIPSYTYAWQGGGSTTDQLNALSAGTYSVTVTDSSNCSTTINIDVVNPDSLLLNTASSSNPTVCGANDGLAVVGVTGGVTPYSYFWSNGQNQQSAINLATGTFDVTVTDGLGCVRTSTVTLIDPNAPTLTAVNSTVTCSEDLGDVTVTVAGGTAPFTFLWSNSGTDSVQTDLAVGTYSVNVVDDAGCVKLVTVAVQGPDKMDVDFNITYGPAGDGDTDVDAIITGANAPYSTYHWKTYSGVFSTPVAGATASLLTDALNDNYRIVVEDAQGCLDSADVEINNLSVGLELLSAQDQALKVYPNPTSAKVFVSLDAEFGSSTIKVLDSHGRVLMENTIASCQGEELEMDLSGFAKGMYFVMFVSEENQHISKIQVK